MPDQRELFKQFYARICQLDPGKAMGKQIFNLLCSRTLMLRSYQEIVNHPQLVRSAYFSIYLCLFKDKVQYYLPGLLVLSMTYFNSSRPIITLDKKGAILHLNHACVRDDTIVDTPMLRSWNEHSSLEAVFHNIVDLLQGNPYEYEEDESAPAPAETEEQPEPQPEPQPPVVSSMPDFEENIPYASLKIGKMLGQGAFAVVYECEYKGMQCAMKEWKHPLSEYEQKALDREIGIQKMLRHPNCTRLYGVSRTNSGLPVLVMEKADSSLIYNTTKKDGPRLTNKEKSRIILEIAQGLAYIHSLHCVHRDIKLDNILMKNGHPKISDFGLSRTVEGDVAMSMTFCGSPAFMAPELIMHKPVTNTVDVYSFGCIVNEIISERTCYSDIRIRNQQDFFMRIRRGLRPTIFPNTPEEVKVLLNECYKNERYRPNMKTIVEMIEMWQPDEW